MLSHIFIRIFCILTCTAGYSIACYGAAQPNYYGALQSGGYLIGQVPIGSTVQKDNLNVPVTNLGQYFIGFGRDESGPVEIFIVNRYGKNELFSITIEPRTYPTQRIKGVDPAKVNPPDSVLSRITSERIRVKRARNHLSGNLDWSRPFIWPVYGPVTGVYGSQRIFNGIPKNPHFGVDVARPRGTQVRAPAGGKIRLADNLYYSGNTVIIDHGNGLSSTLMHLDTISVKEGEDIKAGEPIGLLGSTGRSTGPHLDWRMNWQDTRIDPSLFVPPMKSLCDLDTKSVINARGEAVVLLHGLGRTSASMKGLAIALSEKGYAVCNQDYPSTKYTIEQLSGYLANAVEKTHRQGVNKVHLVTHSMGGIIARYYLQYELLPGRGNSVMLSPPNGGSEIIDQYGKFGWFNQIMGPAAIQLSSDKNNLPRSLKPMQTTVGIIIGSASSDPWFNQLFNGPHVGKVSVQSARLPEMQDFLIVKRGHTFIMNGQEIWRQILFFLLNQKFDQPA